MTVRVVAFIDVVVFTLVTGTKTGVINWVDGCSRVFLMISRIYETKAKITDV